MLFHLMPLFLASYKVTSAHEVAMMLGIQGRTLAAPQVSPAFTQAVVSTAREVSKGAPGSLPSQHPEG